MGGAAGSSASRAVCPCCRSLGGRYRAPSLLDEVAFHPKQTGPQAWDRQIDIRRFSVQPGPIWQGAVVTPAASRQRIRGRRNRSPA